MEDTIMPALIIFGLLLVIALYGLIKSNASAERLNRSGQTNYDANLRRDDASRMGTRP